MTEITEELLAEKARVLAKELARKEIEQAEVRVRRDTRVEMELSQHEDRLNGINGSITRTLHSLEEQASSFREFAARQEVRRGADEAREKEHWKEKGQAFSAKQVYTGYALVLVSVLSMLTVILTHTF